MDPATVPAPEMDVTAFAQYLLEAVQKRNWALGAALAIVAIVWGLRRLAGDMGAPGAPAPTEGWRVKLSRFLHNPIVSWAMPSALSVAMAIVAAATAGQAITAGLILGAIVVGLAGNGAYNGKKKLDEARAAGKAASAAVASKAEAVAVLEKGPQK